MVDGAVNAGTPAAASPATGQVGRYAEVLAELTEMALELARAFQGTALAATRAGDLDRAAAAEAGFNRTALGIRRAVALDARLRQQREEAKHKAETRRQQRQEEKDDRRQIVAETLSRAIAAGKPEAKERLTADLWSRLTEDDRIDADLADTALPVETLALRLGRQLGLSRRDVAAGLGPETKAGPARAAPKPWDEIPAAGHVAAAPPPPEPPRTGFRSYRGVDAKDFGGPEGERWVHCITSGEVLDRNDKVVMTLPVPAEPWRPLSPTEWPRAAAPPDTAPPPDPGGEPPGTTAPPGEDQDEAERKRLRRERDAEGRRMMMMAHIFRHA